MGKTDLYCLVCVLLVALVMYNWGGGFLYKECYGPAMFVSAAFLAMVAAIKSPSSDIFKILFVLVIIAVILRTVLEPIISKEQQEEPFDKKLVKTMYSLLLVSGSILFANIVSQIRADLAAVHHVEDGEEASDSAREEHLEYEYAALPNKESQEEYSIARVGINALTWLSLFTLFLQVIVAIKFIADYLF